MVGYFSPRIKKMQRAFKALSEKIAKPVRSKGGALMVPKHEAETELCEKCGKYHSINEHRFHGEGSHLRTHGDEGEGARRYSFDVGGTGKKATKAIANIQKAISKVPKSGGKGSAPGKKGWRSPLAGMPWGMTPKEREKFVKARVAGKK